MAVVCKGFAIEAIEATEEGADPEFLITIDAKAYYHIVTEAVVISGIVFVLCKAVLFPIIID